MGRNTLRDQKKRKQRERRIRETRIEEERHRLLQLRHREYARTYPGFVLEPNNADPEFVGLIRSALSRLNLGEGGAFRAWESHFYRLVKAEGAGRAYAELEAAMSRLSEEGDGRARFLKLGLELHLGQVVFDEVHRAELTRYLLYNDVLFVPCGREIRVIFKALLSAKGRGGTAYYSPHRPTIEVDGEPKVVAFSAHAMERICGRIEPEWDTYAGHGDVFGFFGSCVYFEKCVLHGGQLGFTFYDHCDDDKFWQNWYDLLPEDWSSRYESHSRPSGQEDSR